MPLTETLKRIASQPFQKIPAALENKRGGFLFPNAGADENKHVGFVFRSIFTHMKPNIEAATPHSRSMNSSFPCP